MDTTEYEDDHPAESWRLKKGMTQSEFCRMAGLSISQYNDATRSLRTSFGRRVMHRIVDATKGKVSYKAMMEWDRAMHWTPEASAKRQTQK